jgi:hypothetical protein
MGKTLEEALWGRRDRDGKIKKFVLTHLLGHANE